MDEQLYKCAVEAGFSELWLTARSNPPDYLSPQNLMERFAELVIKHDREQLAKKIEKLPFGDTSQSFAVWVRQDVP